MANNKFDGLEEQLNTERQKVDVSSVSFSTRELVRMHQDDELNIDPEFQRKYRWTERKASRFIESLFLGLPIPPIFVATNGDFQWEVVDGVQRISTLIRYMAPAQLSMDNLTDPLSLNDLEKLSQLNGTSFQDLPTSIQRYFARQPLQVIALTDKSDQQVRFDLFERLNSGSEALTAQEVRTAVYRGPFLDFIKMLADDPRLEQLLKLQNSNQKDGTTEEQVLKFFAYKNNQAMFKGAVAEFLNNYAKDADDFFDYPHEKELFDSTLAFLTQLLDGQSFLRRNTNVTPLVQFEACMVAIGQMLERGDEPVAPAGDWLNDDQLVEASTRATNTKAKLKARLDRAEKLFSGAADE